MESFLKKHSFHPVHMYYFSRSDYLLSFAYLICNVYLKELLALLPLPTGTREGGEARRQSCLPP